MELVVELEGQFTQNQQLTRTYQLLILLYLIIMQTKEDFCIQMQVALS